MNAYGLDASSYNLTILSISVDVKLHKNSTVPGFSDLPREVIKMSRAIFSNFLCFADLCSFFKTSARRKYPCLMLLSSSLSFASSILCSQYSTHAIIVVIFWLLSFFLRKEFNVDETIYQSQLHWQVFSYFSSFETLKPRQQVLIISMTLCFKVLLRSKLELYKTNKLRLKSHYIRRTKTKSLHKSPYLWSWGNYDKIMGLLNSYLASSSFFCFVICCFLSISSRFSSLCSLCSSRFLSLSNIACSCSCLALNFFSSFSMAKAITIYIRKMKIKPGSNWVGFFHFIKSCKTEQDFCKLYNTFLFCHFLMQKSYWLLISPRQIPHGIVPCFVLDQGIWMLK